MRVLVIWQKETKITYKRFSTILSYKNADRIGKEKGYGETVLVGLSLPFRNRIIKAMKDFRAGMYYKYPICCVLNFCFDVLLDRPSAQLRWSDKTDFVECCFHVRKHGKQVIPLNLY